MPAFSPLETFEQAISKLSIDVLTAGKFKTNCRNILKRVSVPQEGCKLQDFIELKEKIPTFKCRLQLFQLLIEEWIEKYGCTINDDNDRAFFCKQLSAFLNEKERDCPNEDLRISSKAFVEQLFKTEDMKLVEGVLVRKSADRVCIIITNSKTRPDVNEELVLHYNAKEFPGLGLGLKLGDILRIFPTSCKGESLFDLEVARHISVEEDEMETFLSKLLELNPASVALTETHRCSAAWDYILQCEKLSNCISETILELCVNFCSSLSSSKFLSHVLPSFIKEKKEIQHTDKCFTLLQDFLVFVLNADPSCGQKVVNIANSLASKVIDCSDDKTAKEAGKLVCKFQCKLSTGLALKIPGVSSDVASLDWSDLPLIPTSEEIHHSSEVRKKIDLPTVKEFGTYDSQDAYLDTYVRLMREECLYKLRTGISDFVQDKHVDSRDVMLYRATLKGICTEHDDSNLTCLSVELSLDFINETASEQLDSESSHWLMHGNLLCISLDDTFKKPVWALVQNMSTQNSDRIVRVKFCTARNPMSDAEIISKLQELEDEGEKAYMAESSTFYAAFGPAMEVLQHRDGVPFKEHLVDAKQSIEPPRYIIDSTRTPDWGIIFEEAKVNPLEKVGDEASSEYSVLEDLDKLMSRGLKSKLDNTQLEAVKSALHHKLALIQGPPGTGKTYVGVTLLKLLLSMKVEPILVVAYKNHAVDDFLEKSLESIPSLDQNLVRVPRPKSVVSQGLQDCSLAEVAKTWSSHLFNRRMTVLSRVRELQAQVRDCWNNLQLRQRNLLSVETIIMEASSAQIKSLIEGDVRFADEPELENLLRDHKADPAKLSQDQKDLIEKALIAWLPEAEYFKAFADERRVSANSNTFLESESQTKVTESHSPQGVGDENPIDLADRFALEEERLLAADDEVFDEKVTQRKEKLKPLLRLSPGVKLDDFTSLVHEMNIHALTKEQRIALVHVWQKQYHKKSGSCYQTLLREFDEVAKKYEEKYREFEEVRHQHHIEILKKRKVIGMTVDGAAIRAKLLADIEPLVMIVEEAAEILEPQLVAIIPPSVKHLIMIGDHKQLRPTVMYNKLAREHHFNISLFERLINCNLPYKSLGTQCRMRDELAELMRKMDIYGSGKYETNHELVQQREFPSYMTGLSVMYFVDHTEYDSDAPRTYSKRNVHEAVKVSECVQYLLSRGVPSSKVTVLCSYRGQVKEIRQRLTTTGSTCDVDTIDSFQGKENDIIIVSLVRSNQSSQIGFLKSINRLCVAISRARFALYLFGNSSAISKSSRRGWNKVVDYMLEERCLSKRSPFKDRTSTAGSDFSPRLSQLTPGGSGATVPFDWTKQCPGKSEEQALALPDHFMSLLTSAAPNEVVEQAIKCLQIKMPELEEPSQENKHKIRRLASLLKDKKRLDVIKHLREIVPAGTTGPLQHENLPVWELLPTERSELTVDLSGREKWKVVAEKLGCSPSRIRYLDVRTRNPFDGILEYLPTLQPNFTIGKLYDILVECELPTVADLI